MYNSPLFYKNYIIFIKLGKRADSYFKQITFGNLENLKSKTYIYYYTTFFLKNQQKKKDPILSGPFNIALQMGFEPTSTNAFVLEMELTRNLS